MCIGKYRRIYPCLDNLQEETEDCFRPDTSALLQLRPEEIDNWYNSNLEVQQESPIPSARQISILDEPLLGQCSPSIFTPEVLPLTNETVVPSTQSQSFVTQHGKQNTPDTSVSVNVDSDHTELSSCVKGKQENCSN